MSISARTSLSHMFPASHERPNYDHEKLHSLIKFRVKNSSTKPAAGSALSEMWRLLKVFLSIESITGSSLLSRYSTSGLLKESQVDIVSSIETEASSFDLEGERLMLQRAGKIVLIGAALILGKTVIFGRRSELGFTFNDEGRAFPTEPVFKTVVGCAFFIFAILFELGTLKYGI